MIEDSLAAELRETKDTISRHQRNLKRYESDEQRIIERFDGDIQRFKTLKGIKQETGLADRPTVDEQTASARP
jgi:hypothetical protein